MPGDNYHLFRGALQPAQETVFQQGGGCWLFRMKRIDTSSAATASGSSTASSTPGSAGGSGGVSSPTAAADQEIADVNRLWEKLLLSLVGPLHTRARNSTYKFYLAASDRASLRKS